MDRPTLGSQCPLWQLVALTLMFTLTGCGGGGGGDTTTEAGSPVTLSGSVGDGPIIGARISVRDAEGVELATAISDGFAKYRVSLPPHARYPLTIVASGGTDLVTNAPPTFDLISAALDRDEATANLSPFSTILVQTARAMPGGMTSQNVSQAQAHVLRWLNFGLDPELVPDMLHTPVDAANVANVVKASEALGEMVRRTAAHLGLDEDHVLETLAGDVSDGYLDGSGADADPRLAATAHLLSGQVLLETMANRLKVLGVDAQSRLDLAIQTAEPSVTQRVADVPITEQMIAHARTEIQAVLALHATPELEAVAAFLDGLPQGRLPASVPDDLPADAGADIEAAVGDVLAAGGPELAAANAAARDASSAAGADPAGEGVDGATAPAVTLAASPADVAYGGSTTITWSASHADFCVASGAWSGSRPLNDNEVMGPLTSAKTYRLSCNGPGGSASESVTVAVSAPAPTISLLVNPTSIDYNASATISWQTKDASACVASGAWSGAKATAGSELLGPLSVDSSFSLSCTGPGGKRTRTVSVDVGSPPPKIPTLRLTAIPSSVDYGGVTTLTWTSSNTTGCAASGAWSGNKPVSNSQIVSGLTADSRFALTCQGAGGQVSQAMTVSVAAPPPTVSLTANPSRVDYGASTRLSWSSSHADTCTASGSWSGVKKLSGSQSVADLTDDATFVLRCTGAGGTAIKSVTVSTSPAPALSVSLSADTNTVDAGGRVTLSWTSNNAASCVASGAWSGPRSRSSSATVGPLDADSRFVLTCTGVDGSSAADSVAITVNEFTSGTALLSWTPPTTHVDGSALTDLAGYHIYYGSAPGSFPNKITLQNAGISSYLVENLMRKTYYFVVTAFDAAGNESEFSNMASKTVN